MGEEGVANAMDFTTTQLATITSAITNVIDVATIVPMLAAIIGVAAGFVLMWFGVRKGISAVMSAVRRGRLGV